MVTYTILSKTNVLNPWVGDFHIYKECHLVECFFNEIKHFKRITTSYDKLAILFMTFSILSKYYKRFEF